MFQIAVTSRARRPCLSRQSVAASRLPSGTFCDDVAGAEAGLAEGITNMNAPGNYRRPYLALIADDPEAARRLTRMLLAHGAPSVRCLDGGHALMELGALLQAPDGQFPDLLVVDLMGPADATASMIKTIRSARAAQLLPIVVILPAGQRHLHELQFAAGADAVFERLSEATDYRREAARLVSYWVRNQRLDAVGF